VLEELVSDVATVVVVLVTVTVILRVCADEKLELPVALVEVESIESVVVAMLVLEVDGALFDVEPEVVVIAGIDVEGNIEAVVAEFNPALFCV